MDETTPTTAPTPAAARPARDEQIARVAADAAIAVAGVHHLGTPVGRVLAGVQATATGRDVVPGVRVATRLDGTEVMVSVVADYPVNVTDVAGRVRDSVALAVAGTGAGDVIVAVTVTDVHGPYDRDEAEPEEAVEADQISEASPLPGLEREPDVRP